MTDHGTRLECVRGDITRQEDMDAVVNAANAELAPGGGVAGAIHEAAGPRLYDEALQYAPIQPGQAIITGAYDLPNTYVIHCLGPRYGLDAPAAELLASCYEAALMRAEEAEIRSIAFPAISAGAFGYPLDEAATVAMETVKRHIPALKTVKVIRFVLFTKEAERGFLRARKSERSS